MLLQRNKELEVTLFVKYLIAICRILSFYGDMT